MHSRSVVAAASNQGVNQGAIKEQSRCNHAPGDGMHSRSVVAASSGGVARVSAVPKATRRRECAALCQTRCCQSGL